MDVYSVAVFAKGKLCDQNWENKISRESKWEGQSMIQTLHDSGIHLGMSSLERPRPDWKTYSCGCKFCRGKRATLQFFLTHHLWGDRKKHDSNKTAYKKCWVLQEIRALCLGLIMWPWVFCCIGDQCQDWPKKRTLVPKVRISAELIPTFKTQF